MTITILYFAAVRELVGKEQEHLDVPTKVATVRDLAVFLATHHPALAGRLDAVRFAVNETFATNEEAIADGDVVALVPPVAGG